MNFIPGVRVNTSVQDERRNVSHFSGAACRQLLSTKSLGFLRALLVRYWERSSLHIPTYLLYKDDCSAVSRSFMHVYHLRNYLGDPTQGALLAVLPLLCKVKRTTVQSRPRLRRLDIYIAVRNIAS